MKTLKNIKNYSLGFVVGVACISSIAYGASNGSIGELFNFGNLDGQTGVWRLDGVNIQDGTIGTNELGNSVVNQNKVQNGYVDLLTTQSIGGVKTFTDIVTVSKGSDIKMSFIDTNSSGLGQIQQGSNSLVLASNTSLSFNAGSDLANGTPSGQALIIRTTGEVGIGTSIPAHKLDVVGQVRATDGFLGNLYGIAETAINLQRSIIAGAGLSGGGLLDGNRTLAIASAGVTPSMLDRTYVDLSSAQTITGTKTFSTVQASQFLYTSDKRFKDNIETIKRPLQTVQALRGVTWNWKKDGKSDMGFIAQEVEEVLPELVNTNENGYKSVQYANMVGLLVEAVKEQQKQIDELNAKLNALQK